MTIPEYLAAVIGCGFVVRLLLGAYAGILQQFEHVVDAMLGRNQRR